MVGLARRTTGFEESEGLMMSEGIPWTVANADGVVISETDLPKVGIRLIDRLITDMIRDEKPSTHRFQRIQTLCSIGAHLNQLYAVSIDEAQPIEEELGGGLGYVGVGGGYGGGLPMPVPMPRARNIGRFAGNDQAELIRMVLAAAERLNPQQREVVTAVARAAVHGAEAAVGVAVADAGDLGVAGVD